MRKLKHFKRLARLVVGLYLFGTVSSALAEPPMWLIEDENSKIYLFGTVHLLDPDIEWQTERVMSALGEATQLWEEIPMPSTLDEMQAMQGPVMIQRALSPGRPLSSLLSDDEKALLERALKRTPNPDQLRKLLENMKPWFSVTVLGISPLLSAGYDPGAGADIVLAQIAREQGSTVHGFETIEEQADMFSQWTEDQQLAALRRFLAISDEDFEARIAAADASFRAWMEGNPTLVEANIERWRKGEDELMSATMPFDVFITNRNSNWTDQIANLLSGEGVIFVAVGAGHLVGPESVLNKLEAQGIQVSSF